MAISPEKFVLPLTVFAAVVGVYAFFRSSGLQTGQAAAPNTSQSGVPNFFYGAEGATPVTQSVDPGFASAALYTIPQPSPSVSIQAALANPSSPLPSGGDLSSPPPYQTENQLVGNLTAQAASAPANTNVPGATNFTFVDGSGVVPLSSSRKFQVAGSLPNSWLPRAAANVNAYIALQNNAPLVGGLPVNFSSGSLG